MRWGPSTRSSAPTARGDHGDQEPWSFGEPYTDLARHFIELRYRLLPYMYTTFWQYATQGTPMLRPLTFLDQNDTETYLRMAEFGLGDNLLVCPITQPGAEGRWMYLPRGDWFYYWTDEPQAGGSEVWAAADLTRIPLFMRAGAVVPMQPVMQYVGEKAVERAHPARVLQKRHRRERALRRRRRRLRLPGGDSAKPHRPGAPLHRAALPPAALHVHCLLAVRHGRARPCCARSPFWTRTIPKPTCAWPSSASATTCSSAPSPQPGADGRWMYLPRGDWFYYWTDTPQTGGSEVWAAADLTRIPLFMRAGAVVPMQPVLQYVGEKTIEQLTLHVYYKNGKVESVHYDDGGEGYAYREGQRTVRRFTVTGSATDLVLTQAIEGDYQPSYATYRVVLHGVAGPIAVTADGQAATVTEATLETGFTTAQPRGARRLRQVRVGTW